VKFYENIKVVYEIQSRLEIGPINRKKRTGTHQPRAVQWKSAVCRSPPLSRENNDVAPTAPIPFTAPAECGARTRCVQRRDSSRRVFRAVSSLRHRPGPAPQKTKQYSKGKVS